jgi:hypothetical protein
MERGACDGAHVVASAVPINGLIPLVAVEQLPAGVSSAQYVHALEAGEALGAPPLDPAAVVDSFLASDLQTMVVTGEPGAGKSTFLWSVGARVLREGGVDQLLGLPLSRAPTPMTGGTGLLPWIPVFMDVSGLTRSELFGALPTLLESCAIPKDAVHVLTRRLDAQCPVRLLLLCDGLDELAADAASTSGEGSLADFVTILCGVADVGGKPLPCAVKVIATCRGVSGVAGGIDWQKQLVLLPLLKPQVREWS